MLLVPEARQGRLRVGGGVGAVFGPGGSVDEQAPGQQVEELASPAAGGGAAGGQGGLAERLDRFGVVAEPVELAEESLSGGDQAQLVGAAVAGVVGFGVGLIQAVQARRGQEMSTPRVNRQPPWRRG